MQNLLKNIPVILLCGGKGTRILEETSHTPKPLIKLDKYSLVFHIIKTYLKNGSKEFIIVTGYKHSKFINHFKYELPKLLKEKIIIQNRNTFIFKNFTIKIINTGLNTPTAGRILKIKKYIKDKKYFAVTYGDGLSNVNIKKTLIKLKESKKYGILCIKNPPERFGKVKVINNLVINFNEKKIDKNKWINIGYFIFKNQFLKYLNAESMLETKPLNKLTKNKKLIAFKHDGFYQCIDFLNEKKIAQDLIKKFKVPPWLN